ncbi:MAG: hypothetical protein WCI00_07540 [bacterium]
MDKTYIITKKDKTRLDFDFRIHIILNTPITESMNTLAIIIVMWTFFIATDQVKISETTNFGYTVQNSEAILQDHDVTIVNTKESKTMFVRLNMPTPIQAKSLRIDKELPAT